MSTKPIIVSIEGNIGSGKTTIIENLETHLELDQSILFLREPLDVWESVKDPVTGENILQKFYANPDKYAFAFQVMAYATRLSMVREAIKSGCGNYRAIVLERSLAADKRIFAKMLYDDGKIDDICYQIYEKFYKEFSDEVGLDGIVYIDADAEVCKQRVEKRSRQGEDGIPLDYLQKCKRYHDEWMSDEPMALKIKTNQDVTYDSSDSSDQGNVWLKQISDYIYDLIQHEENHQEWKRR
jgi:deoxycitidine kinase/deoxyguanosine kinase